MRLFSKIEPWVFYALLFFWLSPIWIVDFFVTGDGPCHLYNSKILFDLWQDVNADFYAPFYFLNTNFEPNWFANLFMTGLMPYLSATTVEKLFLSAHIILFSIGLRFLLNSINKESIFLSSFGLLFAWQSFLLKGFYNFSIGISLSLWLIYFFLISKHEIRHWLLLAFLFLVVYSSHLIGVLFAGLAISMFILGRLLFELKNKNTAAFSKFIDRSSVLLLSSLPVLVLTAEYIFRKNGSAVHQSSLTNLYSYIIKVGPLLTLHSTERDLAKAVGVFCILSLIIGMISRMRKLKIQQNDGFVLLFISMILICIFAPAAALGGLEVQDRLVFLGFICCILALATCSFPKWFQIVSVLFSSIILFGFLNARIPKHKQSSEIANEIDSCNKFIDDKSVLLTLNYNWNGADSAGNIITNRVYLFNHVDCYLGRNKSLVISDNYEANYWYFPLIERWETNLYKQTAIDRINFDHRPPRADILGYPKRSNGQNIDYVLLLFYNDTYANHPYTLEIFEQLNTAYKKIHTSEKGTAILFKRIE